MSESIGVELLQHYPTKPTHIIVLQQKKGHYFHFSLLSVSRGRVIEVAVAVIQPGGYESVNECFRIRGGGEGGHTRCLSHASFKHDWPLATPHRHYSMIQTLALLHTSSWSVCLQEVGSSQSQHKETTTSGTLWLMERSHRPVTSPDVLHSTH